MQPLPVLRGSSAGHKWALSIATALPLMAIAIAFSLGPSPEKALRNFYMYEGAEEALADPLIEAGRSVVPLVIAEVAKKDMPRRRYAIQFLGVAAHKTALPTLERILSDESEEDYYRADALRAILAIDPHRGLELARTHRARSDLLGYSAAALSTPVPRPADDEARTQLR
jgi:hypothetical protein